LNNISYQQTLNTITADLATNVKKGNPTTNICIFGFKLFSTANLEGKKCIFNASCKATSQNAYYHTD
jgi:hypothetical protein